MGSAEAYGNGLPILLPSLFHRAFSDKLLVYKSPSQPVYQGTPPEIVLNFIGPQGNANSNHPVAKMAKIKIPTIKSVGENEKLWVCK